MFERGEFGKPKELIVIPERDFVHTVYDSQFDGKLSREIAVAELPLPVIFNGFMRFALLDLQLNEMPKGRMVLMSPSKNIYPYTCLDPVFTPRERDALEAFTLRGDKETNITIGPAMHISMDKFALMHDTTVPDLVSRAIGFGLDYAPKEREGYKAGFFAAGGEFYTQPLYEAPEFL